MLSPAERKMTQNESWLISNAIVDILSPLLREMSRSDRGFISNLITALFMVELIYSEII